jgi:8-oxo-dGTP pyrophosphatase MutT (NUDIX family)
MERTSRYPADKHAGQISFPGGRKEDNETILECALRETHEEIGIEASEIEVLGSLSELYIGVSNFLVYPYLAIAKNELVYTPEVEEVQSIIESPIDYLFHPDTVKQKDITAGKRTLKNVPYYDLHGKTLWGATAMITSEILALIKKHS